MTASASVPALHDCVCLRPVAPAPPCSAGKKAGTLKAQCLFLPYIDALSVVVAGKEASRPHLRLAEAVGGGEEGGAGGGDPEGELNFLPPNMPSFSQLDLEFVCKFTEVGVRWGGWGQAVGIACQCRPGGPHAGRARREARSACPALPMYVVPSARTSLAGVRGRPAAAAGAVAVPHHLVSAEPKRLDSLAASASVSLRPCILF